MTRTLGILLMVLASCFRMVALTDTMTGVFDDRVKTLQTRFLDGQNIFMPPVVTLFSDEYLTVSFDILSEDREFLRWRALRCDANWQPSTISELEWLGNGFNESVIENYEFSRATTVHYVHYWFNFPNEDIHAKLSGNYLLQIYEESDPDTVLAQTRVMVSEQTARISGEITTRTMVDYNDAHQQLEVHVDTELAHVADPFNDLKVMISQNGRGDNEIALRQPLRLSGKTAVYSHQPQLVFTAGNEYRRFEVSNVNYPGMGVEDIVYQHPYYHFVLQPDESRAGDQYLYDQTQAGRFVVREYNSGDSDIDSDYVVVHFSLNYPELPGWMIFLDGDLTCRRFDDNSRMFYNSAEQRYEKALLLKQGHYNYQYLAVKPSGTQGETALIEGDKSPTANEYLIKVYTRAPLDRTDRLIGVAQLRFNQ